jgi:hypothetical protein
MEYLRYDSYSFFLILVDLFVSIQCNPTASVGKISSLEYNKVLSMSSDISFLIRRQSLALLP